MTAGMPIESTETKSSRWRQRRREREMIQPSRAPMAVTISAGQRGDEDRVPQAQPERTVGEGAAIGVEAKSRAWRERGST